MLRKITNEKKYFLRVISCIVLLALCTSFACGCQSQEQSEEEATESTTTSLIETTESNKDNMGDEKKLEYDIDTEVRFFGRTYKSGVDHYFNWSSSGFTFSFKGSGAKATFVSNAPGGNNAYIKIYVDGVWQRDVELSKTYTSNFTLAESLDPTVEHTIKVVKRTNARSSTAGLRTLSITDGEKLAPKAASEKLIEFIGDSITVGYSTVAGSATSWSTATEDSTKTYSEQIANYFGADYTVTAISGRGIARNTGGDTDKLLPAIYGQLDAYNKPGEAYDFSAQPDVIIINLGTNDENSYGKGTLTAAEFKESLKAFLKDVRKRNPNAFILYTYGLMTVGLKGVIKQTIEELISEGDSNMAYMTLQLCEGSEKAIGHPTAEAYVSRGEAIIEKIASHMGWQKA